QIIRGAAFALPVETAEDKPGDDEQKDIEGGEVIDGQGEAGQKEEDEGGPEDAVDAFVVEDRDDAFDALGAVVLPVPVIEDDTKRIDKKQAAGGEEDIAGMPLYALDDQW